MLVITLVQVKARNKFEIENISDTQTYSFLKNAWLIDDIL